MKKWLPRIVAGSIALSAAAYALTGDPLLDLWKATKSFEELNVDAIAWPSSHDEEWEARDSGDTSNSKYRLVQQQGGRFSRESQEGSSRAHQRNHFGTLRAFKESVGDNWKCTVQLLESNRQIALGAIVTPDGWIVTKASEMPKEKVEVRLADNSKAEGTVRLRRTDVDLALVKIERSQLPVISWSSSAEVLVGGWLITTDVRNLPVSIGVVSVSSRNVSRERAVLGVKLGDLPSNERGALVEEVVEGSGAHRAGVRSGDVIHRIDGDTILSRDEILKRLGGLTAGQRVAVGIEREGENETFVAQMMDLNHSLMDPTEMEVNGEISARSTGFQRVIQHDTVLAPHQCGGPVVDVEGNAVGLNIARAGRVSSYAVPAKIAAPVIQAMLDDAIGRNSNATIGVAAAKPAASVRNELPSSVPTSIIIESLKPEVQIPNAPR
jgi:serine protease Do